LPVSSWTLTLDQGGAAQPVSLPARLALPDRPLRYTLSTEVVLPPELRGRSLTLAIPYFRALAELRANGEEALSLETCLTARYADPGWHAWHVPAQLTGGPTLKLELAVEHRTVFSARIGTVPRLSASAAGDPVLSLRP
jgi:hypothetical protein